MSFISYIWGVTKGIWKIIFRKDNFINKIFSDQLYFFGVLSFPMVVIVSFLLGMVLTLQIINEMMVFGAESMTGSLVMVSISREVAPVVVSIMIAGRMGSAMAAELGSMKTGEQLSAFGLFGADPVEYFVAPRIFCSAIMLPILTIISIFMSGIASYVLATKFFDISSGAYLTRMSEMIHIKDLVGGVAKTSVFGFALALLSCDNGINIKGGSAEIGEATTDSVAQSIVAIVVLDLAFSFLLFAR